MLNGLDRSAEFFHHTNSRVPGWIAFYQAQHPISRYVASPRLDCSEIEPDAGASIELGRTVQNHRLTPPAIGSDARIRKPEPGGRLAGLVEYIDRDAAPRVPIAADPQPCWS